MSTVKISRKVAHKVISDNVADNRIFGVVYTGRDGVVRSRTGRKGVVSYLKGGDATYDADARGQVRYFDTTGGKAVGYRAFDIERTISLTANKVTFVITD